MRHRLRSRSAQASPERRQLDDHGCNMVAQCRLRHVLTRRTCADLIAAFHKAVADVSAIWGLSPST